VMGDQRVIDAYLGAHHDADITELEEIVEHELEVERHHDAEEKK
jgi:neutral amino acid transport system ATP-binding protein